MGTVVNFPKALQSPQEEEKETKQRDVRLNKVEYYSLYEEL